MKKLNTDILNYFKKKRYFECEIKIASRWQQVTDNKWVIATEPNHLMVDSFRNERYRRAQRRKTVLAWSCLEYIFLLVKWSKNRQYGV